MANSSNRNNRTSNTSASAKKRRSTSTTSQRTSSARTSSSKKSSQKKQESSVTYIDEIILILSFALVIFLFLCTIGIIGTKPDASHLNFGDYVQQFMLGIFGITAYIVPLVAFFLMALGIANKNNMLVWAKIFSAVTLVAVIGIFAHLVCYKDLAVYEGSSEWIKIFYEDGKGGGVIFGGLTLGLYAIIGKVGTIFLLIVLSIISFVIITGKSFINGTKNVGKKIYEVSKEETERYKEQRVQRYEQQNVQKAAAPKQEKSGRKLRGVTTDTLLAPQNNDENTAQVPAVTSPVPAETTLATAIQTENEEDVLSLEHEEIVEAVLAREKNDIHRVILDESDEEVASGSYMTFYDNDQEDEDFLQPVQVDSEVINVHNNTFDSSFVSQETHMPSEVLEPEENTPEPKEEAPKPVAHLRSRDKAGMQESLSSPVKEQMHPKVSKPYQFPTPTLLQKYNAASKGGEANDMEQTARHLEETLETFGVHVKVTDYSRGPAVTRYELQPEQGVKVSKILSLSDDIKLNLAAADIRIEAPIPGKMAVGIEVPNKTSSAVSFRELVENPDFKAFPSNLAFAVGKDIGGKAVFTDIAKMPHVLIAGATGSGKSVCINTLIMSILYKAHPDDVKMIMIDPKVVELNVYNGLPHLLIPVVTDTRKASAALAWGVAEMTDRYKKFADCGVRDLKGYNQKAAQGEKDNEGQQLKKMPQIVIIVDELADLMMVAAKEVEESICRLAQLARAAGIHLIIATQRPSVDVITGLIKANMPSRIAFSVTSGVDSRTILDANGAEKLLGKGDMLFFPQGFSKPTRVQGAFVSDDEVLNVVDFIRNQSISSDYGERIEDVISAGVSSESSAFSGADDQDAYFADAARFVVEKEKGSIGMLQRVFKIGFNRAARIMDQLEAAGIVGPEEGTKPRRILMSHDELEAYLANK